jgi:CBS domain-containing protein
MAYASVTIKDIVERSVNHKWSIPEFQRGFVWKATQVRDLIESLWLNYPVGTLLVWDSGRPVETRSATDAQSPDLWVVDGQQRATALCILSGRKPYWWGSAGDWERIVRKYDIRYDVNAADGNFFIIANAATRRVKGSRYIPVNKLLVLDVTREADLKILQEMAKQVKLEGLCDGMDAMAVYTRLDRIRKIRDMDVVTITVDNDLEDVVEIFSRLNSRGTRVTEADIYLGVVAARTPGWVRDNFLPFVSQLPELGYEISPNLVFRTLTGIGKKAVRYRSIDKSFWDAASVQPVWERTKKAWGLAIKQLKDHGIPGNAIFPADNALVSLIALLDKFPDEGFSPVFYWFLQASRFSRYSTSSTSSMEEDLKEISESSTQTEALERLLSRIRYIPPLTAEDFMRDYSDTRFGRLLLYLLIVRNKALDWDQRGVRIGFDGADFSRAFSRNSITCSPRSSWMVKPKSA